MLRFLLHGSRGSGHRLLGGLTCPGLAGLVLAGLALAACGSPPERDLVRLTDLLRVEEGKAVPLVRASGLETPVGEGGADPETAGPVRVTTEPYTLATSLAGARTGKLVLTARGDAAALEIAWKLASERRFTPFRKLRVPLVADGEEHRYEVDLTQEPFWTGTVDGVRLTVVEPVGSAADGEQGGPGDGMEGAEPRDAGSGTGDPGTVEILELTARPEGADRRSFALGGMSLPSLPGVERLELPLPGDAPRRASFEVHLGIAPQFDRPGTTVRFRARATGRGETPWLDETLEGGSGRRFQPILRRVDVPAGGTVVLEVTAEREGRRLPEGAALWGAPVLVRPEGREPGPHLVILAVDTLRSDVVGAFQPAWSPALRDRPLGGGAVAAGLPRRPDGTSLTPSLDALAAGGVRFDHLHAPSSWTLPSMATLLTGLPPQVHEAGRTLGSEDFAPLALSPAVPTLAERLARAGFYNAGVYNNIFLGPSFGVSRGFDLYQSIEDEDDVLVDRALELLELAEDRRLFLMLHLFGPHNPYAPPAEGCDLAEALVPGYREELGCSMDRRPQLPVPPRDSHPWHEALYHAEVAFTDAQVGRFLAGLEERGLAEDTVVLMVSDHGEDFWRRLQSQWERGYESADHGHAHYQELIRVPGILSAPGLALGAVADPVDMEDLLPTLLGLLGVPEADGNPAGVRDGEGGPPPRHLPGEDLGPVLAALSGPKPESVRPSRRTLLSDFQLYGSRRRAVRRGPWKLVVPDDPELPRELYNLEEDPGELENVVDRHPEVVVALEAALEQEIAHLTELRLQWLAGRDALNAAHLQWNHITKLRALGYLR